ncbi:MAG: hypothetical protein HC783_18695, partial [Rhodobacteraceae bacterium]|nr:hypothetical protein [Paracoccaceae bacterium]
LRAVAIGARPDVAATVALRRYTTLGRLIDEPARLQQVLKAHAAAGPAGATQAEVVSRTGLTTAVVARITLWLAKYHFLEDAP